MEVLKLSSVCLLICIFFSIRRTNNVSFAARVIDVRNVQLLSRPPDKVENITSMNLTSRQNVCIRMMSELKEPILSMEENFYVPIAHWFQFIHYIFERIDARFAIKCPTIPTLYLTRDDRSDWSVRIWVPTSRNYEFNFEVVKDIVPESLSRFEYLEYRILEVTFEKQGGPLVACEGSNLNDIKIFLHQSLVTGVRRLHSLTLEERWWLCVEAQKLIQYKIQWQKNISGYSFQPNGYTYIYSNQYDEKTDFYPAYKCPTNPRIFIRIHSAGVDEAVSSKSDLVVLTLISSDLLD